MEAPGRNGNAGGPGEQPRDGSREGGQRMDCEGSGSAKEIATHEACASAQIGHPFTDEVNGAREWSREVWSFPLGSLPRDRRFKSDLRHFHDPAAGWTMDFGWPRAERSRRRNAKDPRDQFTSPDRKEPLVGSLLIPMQFGIDGLDSHSLGNAAGRHRDPFGSQALHI